MIIFLKIAFCLFFFPFYFVITLFAFAFVTGNKYEGYGGAPYTIRGEIIEKSVNSVRLEITNSSIVLDADVLMQYDPIEKIKSVSPVSLKYFKDFQVGQTVIARTNIHNEWLAENKKRAERVLDILSVEKNRLDPLGADIFSFFLLLIGSIYLAGIILIFRKELRGLIAILKKI